MLFRLSFIFILCLFPTLVQASPLSEPLPVMQMNPAMLRFFNPVPDSAQMEKARKNTIVINQHYASNFLADSLPTPVQYLADMELYIAELQLNYAISQNLAVQATLPLLYAHRGFLDGPIKFFHDAFSMPDGGRSLRPTNSYTYQFAGTNGGWNSSPHWELGNINIQVKYLAFHDDAFDLALLAGIKLPTASRSRGWSSDNSDLAAGAAISWENETLFYHLNGWLIHPLTRSEFGDPVKDYFRIALTTGWKSELFSSWVDMPSALLIQIQGGTSPYRTGVAQLDKAPWLISFGARFLTEKGFAWSLTLTENIAFNTSQDSAQDFSVSLGIQIPLGSD